MRRISIHPLWLPLWLPLCAFTAGPRHDVHVSYCQAEMTRTSCKARVTYYKDDFYKALAAWHGSDVRGLAAQALNGVYAGYMERHFRLTIGSMAIPWKWILKGEDGTSIWFELRTECAAIESATIEHTALFDEYGDQMNLMVLKAAGSEYNFIFTSSKPTASIPLS
jgi:hypothetical protein